VSRVAKQKTSTGNRFGEIAVREGFASRTAVRECLEIQTKLRSFGVEPKRLGEIMVEKGFLRDPDVRSILEIQKLGGSRMESRSGAVTDAGRRLKTSQAAVTKDLPTMPRIPGYEIMELLGEGGMGMVYKARQKSLDRVVALKILPARAAKEAAFIKRFISEARTVARLNHENIIAGIDVGEADGTYYFAMEHVEGDSIADLIEVQGALEERFALGGRETTALAKMEEARRLSGRFCALLRESCLGFRHRKQGVEIGIARHHNRRFFQKGDRGSMVPFGYVACGDLEALDRVFHRLPHYAGASDLFPKIINVRAVKGRALKPDLGGGKKHVELFRRQFDPVRVLGFDRDHVVLCSHYLSPLAWRGLSGQIKHLGGAVEIHIVDPTAADAPAKLVSGNSRLPTLALCVIEKARAAHVLGDLTEVHHLSVSLSDSLHITHSVTVCKGETDVF